MKPTQLTELLANIKATFVSFFSILMFAALGVGVFLGISWAGPALENAGDDLFDKGAFHDFQIQFPYGLTDDDLRQLAEVEGVSQVEPAWQSFQTLKRGGNKLSVKVQSLGRDIDVPLVVEGELPTRPGEVAFHAESAQKLGVSVGDTVTFEHDADGSLDGSSGAGAAGSEGASGTSIGADSSDATSASATSADSSDATSASAASADSSDAASAGAPPANADGASSGMKYLAGDTFKVTAIVNTADYAAKSSETYGYSNAPSGAVDALVWVPDAAFVPSAFQDAHPVANIRCDALRGQGTLSSGYKNASSKIEERLDDLGNVLGTARYDDLHGKAQSEIDKAESQIAEGERQIAEGEEKLEAGQETLDRERAEAQSKLSDAYDELQGYEAQRAQAAAQLDAAERKVSEGESMLVEADAAKDEIAQAAEAAGADKAHLDDMLAAGEITEQEYNESLDARGSEVTAELAPYARELGVPLPALDHTNYSDALDMANMLIDSYEDMPVVYEDRALTVGQARAELADARSALAAAQAEYDEKSAELSAGWSAYYAGQSELAEKTAEGERQLAEGRAQLDDARQQVADNAPKLQEAKDRLATMAKYSWSVLPRSSNGGVIQISTFSNVTNRLSISMATLFIIVGLLVSYFAVSRIVHEQVTQIGTKKALGLRKVEITRSFLLYSGIAVLAGSIIGAAVGFTLVEGIIGAALSNMFAFGAYPAYFGWALFIAITALEFVLVLGATYLACRSILKRHAVELLRGERPPEGKARFYEKWALWERLPLFVQTIVNNCVNDRRRMLSTIVGVAGSTALIVTAITLNNDVLKSYDYHYGNVYGFNAITYVANSPENAVENATSALQAKGASTASVFMKRYLMEQPDGGSGAMRVVVPHDDSFSDMYRVNPLSGGAFDLSGEGAWVSTAYAEHMGAKVGDVVTIDGGDGIEHKIPILGFYEFWLTYHEMVMSEDYYQKEFGASPVPNVVLAQTHGVPVEDVSRAVSSAEGFDSIVDDATFQYGNFATFSTVSGAVVAIYLALAALMAVVVLLNLNVMFIEEKKRELIVLMINGFSVKDAKRYISYDSIVLSAIGIIAGVIVGCIMGAITVASIEPSTGVFVRSPDAWAIIIGIVGSAILAIVMSVISLRRIPRFNLTDINKQ